MTPPRIPSHEPDEIVDMTPPYNTEDEADEAGEIIDLTPPHVPTDEPEVFSEPAPPGAANGAAPDASDMLTPYPPQGPVEAPSMASPTESSAGAPQYFSPDLSGQALDGRSTYGETTYGETTYGETTEPGEQARERAGMAAPPSMEPTAPPKPEKPEKPEKRHVGPPRIGGGRWKLIAAALAGLVLVGLALKVLGPLSGVGPSGLLGGGQGSQPTSVPETSTPVVIGTQPITTSIGPLLLLNPGVVKQGSQVGVTASGFDPGAPVDVTITRQGSATALSTTHAKADKSGMVITNVTVPTSLSSGTFVVTAQQPNSKNKAQAVGTVAGGSPQVKLSKQVGQPGTPIVITLNGFAPREKINVYWNAMSGNPVTTLTTDGGGGIGQAPLRVPFGAVGNNTFLFVGATSQSLAATNFLVLALYPTVKLTSYALKADNVMSYSGSGFGPGERVLVFVNSTNAPPIAVIQTDDNGAFKNAPGFVVPFSLTGKQTLIFMGEQSRAPNAVTFTVLPYQPIVQPSTYGGFPGTTVAFYATGFARNEVVHVYAGHTKSTMGTMVNCFQTDDRGNAGAAGSYLIPGDAQGTVGFALVGAKSGGVGVASINISAPPTPVKTPPQPKFTCPLDQPAQQSPAPQQPGA